MCHPVVVRWRSSRLLLFLLAGLHATAFVALGFAALPAEAMVLGGLLLVISASNALKVWRNSRGLLAFDADGGCTFRADETADPVQVSIAWFALWPGLIVAGAREEGRKAVRVLIGLHDAMTADDARRVRRWLLASRVSGKAKA